MPPQNLHSRNLSGTDEDINSNPRSYYLAAIEAMDTEIGRLLSSLDQDTLRDTLVIFMGDNGTPGRVRNRIVYANGAKGTLYEGGLAVPMVISGSGVTRKNERDSNLINSTDLFATIIEIAGGNSTELPEDSISFARLLNSTEDSDRTFSFTEYDSDSTSGWAIRNENYKLINNGSEQQLFKLDNDPYETVDLANDQSFSTVKDQLNDLVTNLRSGSNEPTDPSESIDITNKIFTSRVANCREYVAQYSSSVTDIFRSVAFTGI